MAPGEEGYFGILANHAPMLSTLGEGKLILRWSGTRAQYYRIAGGFLEVHRNKVTLLAQEMKPFSST